MWSNIDFIRDMARNSKPMWEKMLLKNLKKLMGLSDHAEIPLWARRQLLIPALYQITVFIPSFHIFYFNIFVL
jgi:hypothetical protein